MKKDMAALVKETLGPIPEFVEIVWTPEMMIAKFGHQKDDVTPAVSDYVLENDHVDTVVDDDQMGICSQCKTCDMFLYDSCANGVKSNELEKGSCSEYNDKRDITYDNSDTYSANREMTDFEMDTLL